MANQINELALRLPHPDAVTNAQVVTLLNIVGMLLPLLTKPEETIPGKSNPDGNVSDSAAATFISVCNRLDEIVADKSRWNLEFQKNLEQKAEVIHQQNLGVLRTQQAAAAEVISPHFRYRPNVARSPDGGWMAYLGDPTTTNVILGLGRSPNEAVLNFDSIFKGTVPPYMVEWLAAREQALEEDQTPPPFPNNTNENRLDQKRNRTAKKSPKRRKDGAGDSGNPS
ncbi:MAG TPA: hypothetical protein VLF94_07905 [Chlamydiales bacterium]|nr:hypothetical protein [Chlamydiales bacterium]